MMEKEGIENEIWNEGGQHHERSSSRCRSPLSRELEQKRPTIPGSVTVGRRKHKPSSSQTDLRLICTEESVAGDITMGKSTTSLTEDQNIVQNDLEKLKSMLEKEILERRKLQRRLIDMELAKLNTIPNENINKNDANGLRITEKEKERASTSVGTSRSDAHFLQQASFCLDKQYKDLLQANSEKAELFLLVQRQSQEITELKANLSESKEKCEEITEKYAAVSLTNNVLNEKIQSGQKELCNYRDHADTLKIHITKLSCGLRIEADSHARTLQANQKLQKQLDAEKNKVQLLKEKGRTLETTMHYMKKEVDMLAGQMHLADNRYAEVKSKLNVEQHRKNKESEMWKRVAYNTAVKVQQKHSESIPFSKARNNRNESAFLPKIR